MSEPMRFSLKHYGQLSCVEHCPEGEYVRWEDYDATCETLAHTETERDASDAEVERLKAEVERLRKELAEAQENYHLVNEMVARLRKEGKQS